MNIILYYFIHKKKKKNKVGYQQGSEVKAFIYFYGLT
jgi:hypothetical protein